MAKPIYTQMKSIANGMLTRLGTAVVLTSREGGQLKGKAVLLNSVTAGGSEDVNSKTVYFQGSDKDPAPAPGDVVTIKGENWGILTAQDINPDNALTILFKLEVTK